MVGDDGGSSEGDATVAPSAGTTAAVHVGRDNRGVVIIGQGNVVSLTVYEQHPSPAEPEPETALGPNPYRGLGAFEEARPPPSSRSAGSSHAAFSPDGMRLASGGLDGKVRIWDGAMTSLAATLEHEVDVAALAFSRDGARLMTATRYGSVRIWDPATGFRLALAEHPEVGARGMCAAALVPDGEALLTASLHSAPRLWDATQGKLLRRLGEDPRPLLDEPEHHYPAPAVAAVAPDGRRAVVAVDANAASVFDTETGARVAVLEHASTIFSCAFSLDGKRVLTADADAAKLWDAATGKLAASFEAPRPDSPAQPVSPITAAALGPDARHVATGSEDGHAHVWDAVTGKALVRLAGHRRRVRHVAFRPDGRLVITSSEDGTAKVWSAPSGTLVASLEGHESWVTAAAFHPGGVLAVTASSDGTAKVWDAPGGKLLTTIHASAASEHVAFSPDGALLATAGSDHAANLWHLRLELRAPAEIAALQRCRGHFRLDGEGRLMPNEREPSACPPQSGQQSQARRLYRAHNLLGSGIRAMQVGHLAFARRFMEQAQAGYHELREDAGEGAARLRLGDLAIQAGDAASARAHYDEAAARFLAAPRARLHLDAAARAEAKRKALDAMP